MEAGMTFTEQQVVEIVAVEPKRLRAWIRRGWIRPEAREGAPVFAEADVARAHLLSELCDDLGVEEGSLDIVLSLLDQVHGLRRELKALAQALEMQPESVRVEITRLHRLLVAETEETGQVKRDPS
jgi:chaperone modulatory protein CbpM